MAPVISTLELQLSMDGGTVLAALSDGHGLMVVGERPDATQQLARLEPLWSDATDARGRNAVGAQLLEALIPERVRRHLDTASANGAPANLNLRIHPLLALVPWEALFDGECTWQDTYRLTRSILGKRGTTQARGPTSLPSSTIELLLCAVGQAAGEESLHSLKVLARALHEVPQLSVRAVSAEAPRDEGESANANLPDIVQLTGTLEDMLCALEQDAHLRAQLLSAKLLVLDCASAQSPAHQWSPLGERLARLEAMPATLCLVRRDTPTKQASLHVEQMRRMYEQLALGEAVGRSAPEGSAVFGDASLVLASSPAPVSAERSFRQVTALSYDLVGSTELMHSLGAEAYSLALQRFHQRFAEVIGHWGGVSDTPQGDDGIMCYFGVHQADETTVRSALFAALDLVAEAERVGARIRVGVATGMVAVSQNHYVGLSVHLAARIQSLAQPGEVLVSSSTSALVQGAFSLSPFQLNEKLKGFPEASSVFKLERSLHAQQWSQWSGQHTQRLVGRDAEQRHLLAQWHSACEGRSVWLHLHGEAGIGKSRLVSAVADRLDTDQLGHSFVCRCLPETTSRAFAPIIGLLERWFKIEATDTLDQRQTRLSNALASGLATATDLQAVSHLMGVETARYGLSRESLPEPNRRLILRNMVRWMLDLMRQRPLYFVVEDIQWADPSTLDFLAQLKAQAQRVPLLVVVTERLDAPPQHMHTLANQQLHLERLTAESVRELIRSLVGDKALPRNLLRAIEDKSDGVPLFVEMSTRMALEGASADAAGADFQVPATVRDLLMQRLDSLGPARQLAQMCSAMGREFSLDMLLAVAQTDGSGLDHGRVHRLLLVLIQGGLLVASREQANAHFWFRHALIQDVAYQSMWETDRRNLHKLIARVIETRFPEAGDSQPELLARHHTASGSVQEALRWHLLAAKKYKKREAHAEALAHLDAAQHQARQLPAAPARAKLELEVELTRSGSLVVTRGYGAAPVGESFERAMALSHSLGDTKSLLRAQLGVEAYHFARGDFGQAHAYIAQAQSTAKPFNDALTTAMCQWAVANILFHQGEVTTALEKMNECIATCRNAGLKTRLAQSPEVLSLMYSSFSLWALGRTAQAMAKADKAVALAESTGHRLGTGQALGMKAMVLLVCGDAAQAREVSARAVTLCEAGDHEMWTAHARFILGCATAELGDTQSGLAMMDAADALWASTGSILTRSFYLAQRASISSRMGHHDRAQALIEEAVGIVTRHGERYFEPEVLRLQGELLLAASSQTGAQPTPAICASARVFFLQAIRTAQAHQLKALELRARTSLVALDLASAQFNDELPADAVQLQALLAELLEEPRTQDMLAARQTLTRATQRLTQI